MVNGEGDTCRTVLTALNNFCLTPSSCGEVIAHRIKTFTLNSLLMHTYFMFGFSLILKIISYTNSEC